MVDIHLPLNSSISQHTDQLNKPTQGPGHLGLALRPKMAYSLYKKVPPPLKKKKKDPNIYIYIYTVTPFTKLNDLAVHKIKSNSERDEIY